jgi:hypothetical protein
MSEPTAPAHLPEATPKYDHKVIRPYGPFVPSKTTDVTKTWAKARERLAKRTEPRAGT